MRCDACGGRVIPKKAPVTTLAALCLPVRAGYEDWLATCPTAACTAEQRV